jgi:hypothetical protein
LEIEVFHKKHHICIIIANTIFPSYPTLGTGLIATIMLAFGAVCLLMAIPISRQFHIAETYDSLSFLSLISRLHFYAYQVGMAIWGSVVYTDIIYCIALNLSPLPFLFRDMLAMSYSL